LGMTGSNASISLIAPSTAYSGYIDFSIPSVDSKGRILYDFATDSFRFATSSAEKMTLSSTGVLNLPTAVQLATTSNTVSATSGTLTLNGDLHLYNGTKNTIVFNTTGIAAPSFTNRSIGTRIVIFPGISASSTDHAIGVEGGIM